MVRFIRTEKSEIVAKSVYCLRNILTIFRDMLQTLYITRQHRSFSSPSSRFPEIEADSGDP